MDNKPPIGLVTYCGVGIGGVEDDAVGQGARHDPVGTGQSGCRRWGRRSQRQNVAPANARVAEVAGGAEKKSVAEKIAVAEGIEGIGQMTSCVGHLHASLDEFSVVGRRSTDVVKRSISPKPCAVELCSWHDGQGNIVLDEQ